MYCLSDYRDGNLEEVFKHKNHSCPPSIFQSRQGERYDVPKCLTAYYGTPSYIPDADVIVLAGAVVASYMIKHTTCQTCEDYAVKVFLPLQKMLVFQCRHYEKWLPKASHDNFKMSP